MSVRFACQTAGGELFVLWPTPYLGRAEDKRKAVKTLCYLRTNSERQYCVPRSILFTRGKETQKSSAGAPDEKKNVSIFSSIIELEIVSSWNSLCFQL